MFELIKNIDQELFLAINGFHFPIADFLMFWISNKYFWIPLYILLLYLLIKNYKINSIYLIVMLILMITLSDQLAGFFKEMTARLRPCHNPELEGMVHLIKNKCGGKFSFYSAHASNHFSIALFIGLGLRKYIKYIFPSLLFWAAIIAYSRIYLGKHYPLDVLTGSLAGIGIGILFFVISQYLLKKIKFIV